jgi:hypothetical protein
MERLMYKIGEKFVYRNIPLIVEREPEFGPMCSGCVFLKKEVHCGNFACTENERTDMESVVFKYQEVL